MKLEANVRTCAVNNQEVFVVAGSVLRDNLNIIWADGISISGYYYMYKTGHI